jgi:hypothetical protein
MKFKYYFVDGEKVTIDIEISEQLEKAVKKAQKKENKSNRNHSRHSWSYSAILYEGDEYGREDIYIFEDEEEPWPITYKIISKTTSGHYICEFV